LRNDGRGRRIHCGQKLKCFSGLTELLKILLEKKKAATVSRAALLIL